MRISLFVKLTAIAGCAALTTVLFFSLFAREVSQDSRRHYVHHLGRLAPLAMEAVLRDPSSQTLASLTEQFALRIRYRDADTTFASDALMPSFAALSPVKNRRLRRFRARHLPPSFAFMRDGEGNLYLHYRRDERRAIIALQQRNNDEHLFLVGAILAAALLLIWGTVFYLIRSDMAPLAQLRKDMAAVRRGEWRDFKYERRDELGQLGAGFNQMQAQLRDNIALRERFLMDASHELRSPIARLRLAAEMVRDEKMRRQIVADVRELDTLTAGILQNAKWRSANAGLQQRRIDMRAWLRETLAARSPAEQARIDRQASDDESPLWMEVDAALLTRALTNILDNALNYAEHVVVTLETAEGIMLTVGDDGEGVAAADLPRLFEPFFRADTSRTRDSGGFGLGLAIAAAAVEAHGGTITAEPNRPRGLVVKIRFS